jgi:hypothetical protein
MKNSNQLSLIVSCVFNTQASPWFPFTFDSFALYDDPKFSICDYKSVFFFLRGLISLYRKAEGAVSSVTSANSSASFVEFVSLSADSRFDLK